MSWRVSSNTLAFNSFRWLALKNAYIPRYQRIYTQIKCMKKNLENSRAPDGKLSLLYKG